MSPSIHSASILVLSCFLLFSSSATAFNITRLLGRFPEYTTFNDLLSQTKLYEEINSRRTITVLAVNNGAMGAISGQPIDMAKNILREHIVLDYYDLEKLKHIKKGSTLLTTLFQTTGVASHQQGFLNVTNINGDFMFGSAVHGAPLNSKLTKVVASQPYNISVLELTAPIIAPGLGGTVLGPVAAPPPPAKKPASPAPAPPKEEAEAPAEEAEAPTEEVVEAPVEGPAQVPATGPSPAEADLPADEGDAPPPSNASARIVFVSGFGSLMVLMVSLVAAL